MELDNLYNLNFFIEFIPSLKDMPPVLKYNSTSDIELPEIDGYYNEKIHFNFLESETKTDLIKYQKKIILMQ